MRAGPWLRRFPEKGWAGGSEGAVPGCAAGVWAVGGGGKGSLVWVDFSVGAGGLPAAAHSGLGARAVSAASSGPCVWKPEEPPLNSRTGALCPAQCPFESRGLVRGIFAVEESVQKAQ